MDDAPDLPPWPRPMRGSDAVRAEFWNLGRDDRKRWIRGARVAQYRAASGYVRRILCRISRDRWISGREVSRIALQIARRVSGNPHHTAKHSYPEVCEYVGMLDGMPPSWPGAPGYRALGEALNDPKTAQKPNLPELLILGHTLKMTAHGR